jgi:hypothetical protein
MFTTLGVFDDSIARFSILILSLMNVDLHLPCAPPHHPLHLPLPYPKSPARCDLDYELNCCIGQLLDTLAIRERRLCHVSHR